MKNLLNCQREKYEIIFEDMYDVDLPVCRNCVWFESNWCLKFDKETYPGIDSSKCKHFFT